MTPIAIVTMVIICGVVWGGFLTFLVLAIKRERSPRGAGTSDNGAVPLPGHSPGSGNAE